MTPRAVIVETGRVSTGGARRRASWEAILTAAGADVVTVELVEQGLRAFPWGAASLPDVVSGRVVPETLAWSTHHGRERLRELDPDICVFVTLRAFDPSLAAVPRVAILDCNDQLSVSYRDRSGLATTFPSRTLFDLLARSHRRTEGRRQPVARCTLSSYSEAAELGLQWVPTTALADDPVAEATTDHDLALVGNLAFLPNVDGVRWLHQLWPRIVESRPGTTLLLAGRGPTEEVRMLAATNGWTLVADFESMPAVYARTRIALAPIRHATGNQTKVVDAAALGVAQLVTTMAARGHHPDFPLTVVDGDDAMVRGIVELLDDDTRRRAQAEAAQRFVRDWYSPERWAAWARPLLDT